MVSTVCQLLGHLINKINTVKTMVGCTPRRVVSYVSDWWLCFRSINIILSLGQRLWLYIILSLGQKLGLSIILSLGQRLGLYPDVLLYTLVLSTRESALWCRLPGLHSLSCWTYKFRVETKSKYWWYSIFLQPILSPIKNKKNKTCKQYWDSTWYLCILIWNNLK